MYDSIGTLRVRSFTAGGALPISGAVVRLIGADEENRNEARSLVTDRDGVAIFTELPTPRLEYSLTPTPAERPYAYYDLEVSAEGYESQVIRDVSVFSGIESYQPINLLPTTK